MKFHNKNDFAKLVLRNGLNRFIDPLEDSFKLSKKFDSYCGPKGAVGQVEKLVADDAIPGRLQEMMTRLHLDDFGCMALSCVVVMLAKYYELNLALKRSQESVDGFLTYLFDVFLTNLPEYNQEAPEGFVTALKLKMCKAILKEFPYVWYKVKHEHIRFKDPAISHYTATFKTDLELGKVAKKLPFSYVVPRTGSVSIDVYATSGDEAVNVLKEYFHDLKIVYLDSIVTGHNLTLPRR